MSTHAVSYFHGDIARAQDVCDNVLYQIYGAAKIIPPESKLRSMAYVLRIGQDTCEDDLECSNQKGQAQADVGKGISPMIPRNDRELVHQLLEDVETILGVPNFPRPSPAIVRTIFVPVLRRWIVEPNFFAAQKLLRGQEIKFEVAINGNAAKLCEVGYYEHWMAVVLFGRIGVGASQVSQEFWDKLLPFSLGEFRQLPHPASTFEVEMHTSQFVGVQTDHIATAIELPLPKKHLLRDEIKNYFGFDGEAVPWRMMKGDEIAVARADPNRRANIYDATELVALDTARIFAKGIDFSAALFKALLT